MALNSRLCKASAITSILLSTVAVAGSSASKMWRHAQVTNEGKPVQALELKSRDDRYEKETEVKQSSVLQIAPDRLLVSVNNTVYLLDGKKKILWETVVGKMINVPPLVDSRDRIYGIGFDVTQFRVDSLTEEYETFGRDIMGTHSYYTQINSFRDGQHLVVESLRFYRDGNLCYPKCPMAKDSLEDWDGEHLLWKTDFPAKAKLHVQGDKIFAVERKRNSVVLEEIEIPKTPAGSKG